MASNLQAKQHKSKIKTMKVDVILGLQWGDEGKGKIVDVLPELSNRGAFSGWPNAGHTLEFENQKYIQIHSLVFFRKENKS